MNDSTHAELRRDLDSIGRRAASTLTGENRRRARKPALFAACTTSLAIAALYLAYLGMTHVFIGQFAILPAGWLPVFVLAPGAVAYGIAMLTADTEVLPVDALAAADARLGLEDRLRTAEEFLRLADRSAFMEAALLDAGACTDRVRDTALPTEDVPPPFTMPARLALFGAVLLGFAAWWTPAPDHSIIGEDRVAEREVGKLEDQAKQEKKTPKEQPVDPRETETPKATTRQQRVPAAAGRGRKDAQLDSSVKKTRGVLGSGQSADAASASGTSEARGAPSSQAQASKEGKKPTKKKKVKRKKPAKPQDQPKEAKKPENDSGATAGRGAASGSNKSPSASPWSSKDQVTSEDEDDLEDDEEVDDEFDNSDARGGVQPHLRDRRPPVNRDLGIGFGNNKNPDANGRGGPSEMKKSRGVASLVLGVPIPDHVKGRPNPGKTKITQERVEPKAEDTAPASAAMRRPRQAPVGHFANPELEPWMRDLIRTYFKAIRPQPGRTSPPAADLSTKKPGD